VDGSVCNGVGVRGAGSVTALTVAGRGGVAGDASAVVLNGDGDRMPAGLGLCRCFRVGRPQTVGVEFEFCAGRRWRNSVCVGGGCGGRVCVFTSAATDFDRGPRNVLLPVGNGH
jgi:hypothetical protein